ncbi:hypothetical protein PRUPE_6G363400 [Prunus persica]|uniref:Uncharacterized protein n=1 Tax=Prunus persica TaxID=3760 RepID=A0A251P0Z2_PRUPE|nr:hypothetical protein PRUPE_6G363400 [Prunus persica]
MYAILGSKKKDKKNAYEILQLLNNGCKYQGSHPSLATNNVKQNPNISNKIRPRSITYFISAHISIHAS